MSRYLEREGYRDRDAGTEYLDLMLDESKTMDGIVSEATTRCLAFGPNAGPIQRDRIRTVDGARGRGRTGTALRRRDFKSRVSTNFTTRA